MEASDSLQQKKIKFFCPILDTSTRFTAHLCNTVRSKQYEHESSIGDIRSLFRRIYK